MESSFFFLHRLINKTPGRRYQDSPFLSVHSKHLSFLCTSFTSPCAFLSISLSPTSLALECESNPNEHFYNADQREVLFSQPISSSCCELNENKAQWQDDPEQSHPPLYFLLQIPAKRKLPLLSICSQRCSKWPEKAAAYQNPGFPSSALLDTTQWPEEFQAGVQRKDIYVEREHNRGCC